MSRPRRAALIAALAAEQPEETAPPVLETAGALLRLRRRAAREANPRLRALIEAAQSRRLPYLLDDDALTLGAGAGGHSWPLTELPEPAAVDWPALRAIPTALVTGTNGKTTVVRLLAACARAAGHTTGYCCTDGVFVAGNALGTGDYSGPAGARRVLRDAHVEAAILETARGGILRRGLAVARADVAVITSIAADHFGEYGVHDLEALVDVKLAVARALDSTGLLVVNADDALLSRRAAASGKPLGWFAQDADSPPLVAHRRDGGATAGVRGGRLVLSTAAQNTTSAPSRPCRWRPAATRTSTSRTSRPPRSAQRGSASRPRPSPRYSPGLGPIPRTTPAGSCAASSAASNLIVDFAHNPTALAGLVDFARHLRGGGRLALLLGQAGNREDADIDRLAAVAASARPDLVVVKELASYLRGRDSGEMPALLKRALERAGIAPGAIGDAGDEDGAVRLALGWARAGDVLVLPLHSREGRGHALALFERLRRDGWKAGQPLPPT